jgi:lipopolysaccharide export system protein LptA
MVLAGDAPIAAGEDAAADGAGEEHAGDEPSEPAAAALTQPVAFNGSSLLVLFSPDTGAPYQLELEGADEWPALLGTSTADGRLQRLAVGYLLGQFDDGQLSAIQVFDGVELLDLPAAAAEELGLVVSPEPAWEGETPPAGGDEDLAAAAGDEDLAAEQAEAEKAMEDAALVPQGDGAPAGPTEPSFDPVPWGGRVVTAPRAEALLEDGRTLRQVTLYEAVVYRDARLSVRGEQAVLDVVAGDGEFYGRPLELRGQRGELSAPHAVYTRSSGLLHADGGCRAQLEPSAVRGSLGGGPLGAGEGPIWVESEEAWLREVPPVYRFRGAVKAWRGEDLLLADELEADETRRSLSARGSVRTLWHPAPQPGRPAREAPVEVSAGEMEYGQAEGKLLYRKAVRAVQAGRILACQELVVELDSQQRAEKLDCGGEVRIEDPASGRVIEGDRARYQLSGHTVEVEGEAVRMRDESGGEVTGRRLLYDFESGTAQVQSAPPPAAAGAGEGGADGEPAEPGEGGA